MKAIKYIILILLVVTINPVAAKNKKETVAMDSVAYTMPLHGKHCENIIMKNIPYEKGVVKTTVNLDKQQVFIMFKKDKTNRPAILKAFNGLGYKAIEVPLEVKSDSVLRN